MTTLEHSLRSASKVNMHAVLKCWSIDNHFIGETQELVLTDLYFSVVILTSSAASSVWWMCSSVVL